MGSVVDIAQRNIMERFNKRHIKGKTTLKLPEIGKLTVEEISATIKLSI